MILPLLAFLAAPERYPVLAAMPDDPDNGVRLEAAVAVDDLRRYSKWADKGRHTLMLSRLGAEFLTEKSQVEAFGFDWFGELGKILEVASPGGEPVPAAIAAFTSTSGFGAQVLLRVSDGFMPRLAAALGSRRPPAWSGKVEEGTLIVPLGRLQL